MENSQISSVDLLQTRSVSTGLGLSLDDRRMVASSGDSPLLSLFDEEIDRELQRQDAEMDRFVKVQVWSSLPFMISFDFSSICCYWCVILCFEKKKRVDLCVEIRRYI